MNGIVAQVSHVVGQAHVPEHVWVIKGLRNWGYMQYKVTTVKLHVPATPPEDFPKP